MIKGEEGFSLIEVMVAIVLLGVVSVSLLSAIGTASQAVFIADEQASAESLARAEMEYMKTCTYDYYESGAPPSYEKDEVESPTYAGYFISVDAIPIDPDTGEVLTNPSDDEGIQKVVVSVSHVGKPGVVTLEAYKVDR